MGEVLSIKHKQTWEVCPWCGNKVIVIDSRSIYGRYYGLIAECVECKARAKLNQSFKGGLLATPEIRQQRMLCHEKFDSVWKKGLADRTQLYKVLANKLGIPRPACHFSYFNLTDLKRAYKIINQYRWWEK